MKFCRNSSNAGRRLLALSLALMLCFSLLPQPAAFAASDTDFTNSATFLRTSFNSENYLDFSIKGNTVTVSGKLILDDLCGIMLLCGSDRVYGDTAEGRNFSLSMQLGALSEPVSVDIYTQQLGESSYWGMIWDSVYIEQTANGYRFLSSAVLENNLALGEAWLNPADHLNANIPEDVKAKSDEIVGDETDDYTKLFLLHRWTAENIYYDYDYYYNKQATYYDSDAVLAHKRSVCEGYAVLLKDLILAQGIPCVKTTTYALGASTSGGSFATKTQYAETTSSNHAHVEAFVDGRWVAMDPTWDSNNKYQDGEYQTKAPTNFNYFDPTPEMLAMNHKIITRGDRRLTLDKEGAVVNKNTAKNGQKPTHWALPECAQALSLGLIPAELQSGYQSNITREEFCRALVNMLRIHQNVSDSDTLLARHGLTMQENLFTDTQDRDVYAANLLGIINGRSEGVFAPNASITRQEAAAMLMRAAKVLGMDTESAAAHSFSDKAQISDWAGQAVSYVSQIGVMNGVDGNAFAPLNPYTREQSIMTLLRLFRAALNESQTAA